MKKIILLIVCILASISSVRAIENNQDLNLLDISYSNEELIKIGQEKDYFKIASKDIYSITTYKVNPTGIIVDQKTILTTEEKAKEVAENDTLYVGNDGNIHQIPFMVNSTNNAVRGSYQTESKKISIDYYEIDGEYCVDLFVEWFKLPKIRVFDIMALKWTDNADITGFYGRQESDADDTWYYLSSKNIKRDTNAIGLSMNLHNKASKYLNLTMQVVSNRPFGSVSGTYQHARHSNATLAISHSYTFDYSGLGGLVYFSNKTYRSYYDGMKGVFV